MQGLPPILEKSLLLNPVYYCVDLLRGVLLDAGELDGVRSLAVLTAFAAAALWLGTRVFRSLQIET